MTNFKKAASLQEFWANNKIIPKNKSLYIQAITHASYTALHKDFSDYQRLEYLGDSILQFLSGDYLIKKYPDLDQGMLTRVRSTAVRTETLGEVSEKIGLVQILKTGIKQTSIDVRKSPKVKADIFESMLGAIYLDLGLAEAYRFVKYYIFPIIDEVHSQTNKDSKTELQEHFQSISKDSVIYEITQNEDRTFTAKAKHENHIYGIGLGNSKKEAEQAAALEALSKLNIKG